MSLNLLLLVCAHWNLSACTPLYRPAALAPAAILLAVTHTTLATPRIFKPKTNDKIFTCRIRLQEFPSRVHIYRQSHTHTHIHKVM